MRTHPDPTATATLVVLLAIALGTLSACGGGDSASDPSGQSPSPTASSGTPTTTPPSTPTSTPTIGPSTGPTAAADLPDCSAVWVAGTKLPRSYQGCLQGGAAVKAVKHPCSFGSSIIEFDNQFYAGVGKPINHVPDLAHSKQFHSALSACQA